MCTITAALLVAAIKYVVSMYSRGLVCQKFTTERTIQTLKSACKKLDGFYIRDFIRQNKSTTILINGPYSLEVLKLFEAVFDSMAACVHVRGDNVELSMEFNPQYVKIEGLVFFPLLFDFKYSWSAENPYSELAVELSRWSGTECLFNVKTINRDFGKIYEIISFIDADGTFYVDDHLKILQFCKGNNFGGTYAFKDICTVIVDDDALVRSANLHRLTTKQLKLMNRIPTTEDVVRRGILAAQVNYLEFGGKYVSEVK